MRDCETYRDDLKAYRDGELPVLARLTLRLHLMRCPSCREEIEAMDNIGRELRTADAGGLDGALKAKILAGIPLDPPAVPADAQSKTKNRRKPLLIFGATAAALASWFIFYPMLNGSRTFSPLYAAEGLTKSASVSNMKQMGTAGAMNMYTQDYDAEAQRNYKLADQTLNDRTPARSKASAAHVPSEADKDDNRVVIEGQQAPSALYANPVLGTLPPASTASPKFRGGNGRSEGIPAERQVKREASLTVQVDNAETRSVSVEEMTKLEGGHVASSQLSTLDDGTKLCSMVLRVPVDSFDAFLGKITHLGEVKAKSLAGEDLTQKIVDDQQAARVLNEEIGETRKRLNQRQSRTQEKADTETMRELKTRFAQKQARLELMKRLTTLATITVELTEKPKNPPPPPPPPPTGGFLSDLRETAHDAGQAFLQAARLPIVLLVWAVVYAPLWILLLVTYRLFIRAGR